MSKKEIDFEARRARVKEVCAKYNSENRWRETDQGSHFWFDIEHGFAFCVHAKVWSCVIQNQNDNVIVRII